MVDETWNYTQIEDFYNRVRMALNAVSEATLPDSYIDFPEKAPFAELTAKQRIPQWKELDESKFKIFESIIVYQTAVYCQTIIQNKHVKKKQIPTITLEYADSATFDINGRSLQDIVESLVSMVNGNTGSNFIGFMNTKHYPSGEPPFHYSRWYKA